MSLRLLALLVTLLFSPIVSSKTTYTVNRITSQPTINGELSEGEWSQATQVELQYNINPGDSTPAPVKTIAYMMEDGENFYFAFKASDPEPEKILAYIRDRDRIFQDDFVGVILDTFNDERRGFEFFVNALGSQGDLTRDDILNNEDSSWDTVWDSAGQVHEDGYVVEMAVPFRALRFSPDLKQQTWGIQFLRIYPRDSRMVISDSPSDRKIECSLCQVNKVKGMPHLKSTSANFDITPTLTYVNSEERDVDPIGPWETVNDDLEFGADFRWAITEDWILNATINPDFSQVEADSGQLDVNTTFSLFFPEARPFFLDGADYFRTQNRLVHTRNIADPDYGIKVTGKTNGHSVGVIAATDESTSFLIPSSLGSYVANLEGESSDVFIGRAQKDYGQKNSVGTLITHRSATDYENQVFSIDGKHQFSEEDILRYQVMYSNSENPESIQFDEDCIDELLAGEDREDCRDLEQSQSDHALSLSYRHNQKNYSLRANYNEFGKDFRADVGFVGQVDFKKLILGGNYYWYGEEGSKWTRWGFFGDWDKTEDQSGLKLEEESEIHFNLRGPLQFNSNSGLVFRERYFDGEYFDEEQFQMWFEIKPISGLTLGNFMRIGDQVDFANTQLGDGKLFEPYVRWQIGKHFNINLVYTNQSLDVTGGELFNAKLADLRLAYQFNIQSRLSLTIQATKIDRDLSLYNEDIRDDFQSSSESVGTQLIYSYKINPQSLFYLGYSDNALENDDVQSLEKTDRTIFAKFSYLWQL